MLILLTGNPFTGKTVSACTFPGPICYVSTEKAGITSVHTAKDADGNLIVSEEKMRDMIDIVPLHRHTRAPIHLKTPTKEDFKNAHAPEYSRGGMDAVARYNTLVNALYNDSKPPLDMTPKRTTVREEPYRTLIIDSWTGIFQYLKEAIMYANQIPRLRIADYGTMEGNLYGQLIPDMQELLNDPETGKGVFDWIIIIVHELLDKDELSGQIYEQPIGPSKAMGRSMSREFSEVWRQVNVGGQYLWRTRTHGRFASSGSRLSLPDNLTPTFDAIRDLIPDSLSHLK